MAKCNNPSCNNEGILIGKWGRINLAYCKEHLPYGKHVVELIKNAKQDKFFLQKTRKPFNHENLTRVLPRKY